MSEKISVFSKENLKDMQESTSKEEEFSTRYLLEHSQFVKPLVKEASSYIKRKLNDNDLVITLTDDEDKPFFKNIFNSSLY